MTDKVEKARDDRLFYARQARFKFRTIMEGVTLITVVTAAAEGLFIWLGFHYGWHWILWAGIATLVVIWTLAMCFLVFEARFAWESARLLQWEADRLDRLMKAQSATEISHLTEQYEAFTASNPYKRHSEAYDHSWQARVWAWRDKRKKGG